MNQNKTTMSCQVSVVIPVYNGEHHLPQTLRALEDQSYAAIGNYEVIVVDNHSSDGTARVIRSFAEQPGSRVRYVLETEKGVCAARNRGIREALGTYICFTDDDCVAEQRWLEELVRTFEATEAGAVQGKIVLATPIPEQCRFPKDFIQRRIACVDYGDQVFNLNDDQDLVGANMAVRRDILAKFGGFDANPDFFLCEDTEFSIRLARQGVRRVYTPRALIHHHFDIDRLNENFFLRQSWAWGRADIVLEPSELSSLTHWLYCCKGFFRWYCYSIYLKARGRLWPAFEAKCKAWGLAARCSRLWKMIIGRRS